MTRLSRSLALAAPLVFITLGGCTTVGKLMSRLTGHERVPRLQVRAAPTGASEMIAVSRADRLYQAAAGSIERRDYGEALDVLQIAREAAPDDARVLNALGVVYDKLGRFDLSERYYALAARAEPGSPVVASNIRYSAMLRDARDHPASLQAQAQVQPPPAAPLTAADPGALRVLTSAQPGVALVRRVVAQETVRPVTPTLAGGRLMLVNASGRALAAQPARTYLAGYGWTLAQSDQASPLQNHSEIRFEARIEPVAMALARTLPFKVALSTCAASCPFQLVLGRDAPESLSPRGKRS